MSMTAETIQYAIDAIVGIGIIVYGISQWRNGTSKISYQTIQAYKDQLDITEKRYQSQQETLNAQAGQIGELKGLIAGKEAQLADYRKILENRNPNLEKTLEEILTFMRGVDKRLGDIAAHQKLPTTVKLEGTGVK